MLEKDDNRVIEFLSFAFLQYCYSQFPDRKEQEEICIGILDLQVSLFYYYCFCIFLYETRRPCWKKEEKLKQQVEKVPFLVHVYCFAAYTSLKYYVNSSPLKAMTAMKRTQAQFTVQIDKRWI